MPKDSTQKKSRKKGSSEPSTDSKRPNGVSKQPAKTVAKRRKPNPSPSANTVARKERGNNTTQPSKKPARPTSPKPAIEPYNPFQVEVADSYEAKKIRENHKQRQFSADKRGIGAITGLRESGQT